MTPNGKRAGCGVEGLSAIQCSCNASAQSEADASGNRWQMPLKGHKWLALLFIMILFLMGKNARDFFASGAKQTWLPMDILMRGHQCCFSSGNKMPSGILSLCMK